MKQMTMYLFAALIYLLAPIHVSVEAAEEAQFARYPAPSPDGTQIAFSYHGDIWVVSADGGRALRLTVHKGYDGYPVWSPDGSQIAFSSNRFGRDDDVYVMSSTGGDARRLTYMSVGDTPVDWTTDGKHVLFTSNRDYSISGAMRVPYVFSISTDGGEPKLFMPESGNEAKLSPDGSTLAFVTHSRRDWSRIGYRGPSNNDIVLWNTSENSYKQITDFVGTDAVPMWAGDDSLYFLSEEGGYYNIWKYDRAAGTRTQVTSHEDHVRWPSISRDGSTIAYELGLDIHVLDTASGVSTKLNVTAPTDSKFNSIERMTLTRGADEYALSPDETEIAFIVRGELFCMDVEGGQAHRLTTSVAREMGIAWKADGSAIIFSSDRDSDYDLYEVTSDDPEEKKLSKALSYSVTRLTDNPGRESGSDISPDGKKLAYLTGNGTLNILDLETKENTVLVDHWGVNGYSWSPDSKWIAFDKPDREFNNDIWIIPADGSAEAVNITRHPDNEGGAVWSDDGKRIAFISRRMDNNYDVWFVFLTREDHERTKEDWEELIKNKGKGKQQKPPAEEPAEENGEEAEEEEEKPSGPEVKIDFEDIHLRLQRVVSMPGGEFSVAISPDGQTFAFTSNTSGSSELYTVKWDGSEMKQLTNGGTSPSSIRFNKKGNAIYFLRGGGMIQSVSLAGKPTMIGFQARLSVDHPAERMQKYHEAWRTLNRMFYDADFHGADWDAVRAKYEPYARVAVDDRDFSDVVNMMFGHLNGSHLGYMDFDFDGASESTAHLGAFFDESYEGPGLKVTEIIKNSPAYKVASRLNTGDVILSIDGQEVSWETNLSELLIDKAGEKTVLIVNSPEGVERRVIIRPASLGEMRQLYYETFVDMARKRTHELSENRIGYLHVQSMSSPSLERFEMELYSEAHDKDAIVIDVRNNGGGWTTDMMLAMLQVEDHARTSARGSSEWGYPQDRRPLYAWTKPVIVLCNEYSYSNAEIFSWAIQTLGRGLVVGQQTFGAVISTGGYGLIDGSFVRTPFRAWHVAGSDINMENNGCPPDIVVPYQFGDSAEGTDRQLDRAVEELLKQLES